MVLTTLNGMVQGLDWPQKGTGLMTDSFRTVSIQMNGLLTYREQEEVTDECNYEERVSISESFSSIILWTYWNSYAFNYNWLV